MTQTASASMSLTVQLLHKGTLNKGHLSNVYKATSDSGTSLCRTTKGVPMVPSSERCHAVLLTIAISLHSSEFTSRENTELWWRTEPV